MRYTKNTYNQPMLWEKIISILETLKSGWQSAPILVSEETACEVVRTTSENEIATLEDLETRSLSDVFFYDCADRDAKHHGVEKTRAFVEKLYQKPSGDITIAVFLNLDALTANAHNALLKVFEDVPQRLLILVTSQVPEKIIPTLQSRIVTLDTWSIHRGENPFQKTIDDFIAWRPEGLFNLTLGKEFKKEQALWVVTWLQNAVLNGTLSPRNAHSIRETRFALETTNTIAKYLIDKLLISLLCD